ncbi:MAG: hypothetical protein ACK4GO_15180 [Gemmobacter sp.]
MKGGGAAGFATLGAVVEYSGALRTRAIDEVARLPAGSVIVEMMNDYSVMRDQARACRGF